MAEGLACYEWNHQLHSPATFKGSRSGHTRTASSVGGPCLATRPWPTASSQVRTQ